MNSEFDIWNDAHTRRRLIRVALSVLDSPALAEEIVQEAYLRLWVTNVSAIECPLAWLSKVTRNLAIDLARRRMRERELLVEITNLDVSDQYHFGLATENRLAEIVSCLLHVSNSHATSVVLLHVVFGMSYEEIATMCGRSSAACRKVGSRTLRKSLSVLDAEECYDNLVITDAYVQAILDASAAPLIDGLNDSSTVCMQLVAESLSATHGNECTRKATGMTLPSMTGRTRQVLVLTATGVRWALVLDSVVLCYPTGTDSVSRAVEC